MTATQFDPAELMARSRLGVLATIKSDGRPELSPVMPFYDREQRLGHGERSAPAGIHDGGEGPGRRLAHDRSG